MRKFIFAFLLLSCSKVEVNDPVGCQSGINSYGVRVVYRCATYKQFEAGWNVSAGGTADYKDFTDNEWKSCGDCKSEMKSQQDNTNGCLLDGQGNFLECCKYVDYQNELVRLGKSTGGWSLCITCKN